MLLTVYFLECPRCRKAHLFGSEISLYRCARGIKKPDSRHRFFASYGNAGTVARSQVQSAFKRLGAKRRRAALPPQPPAERTATTMPPENTVRPANEPVLREK